MSPRGRRAPSIVRPELVPADRGLGRRVATDPRDRRYAMRAVVPKHIPERDVRRNPGPVLHQGSTSACVGFAWRAWMTSSPVMYKDAHPDPFEIYSRALQLDEWPDDHYDAGTSVRAGAKVMRERGRLTEFVWASTTDDVIKFLAHRGPVVLGTDWHESMFDPLPDGSVRVYGEIAGGHAYLCYGYDADLRRFRCQNSWGPAWADRGRFWMSRSDVDRLIGVGGEACGALELGAGDSRRGH